MPSPHADDPMMSQVSEWADEYVNALEVELTEKMCLCKWIYRDEQPTPNVSDEAERPTLPRLRTRSHEHPECPVHTRRGLILGFFKWASRSPRDLIALISVSSALDSCAREELEEEIKEAEEEENPFKVYREGKWANNDEPTEIEKL